MRTLTFAKIATLVSTLSDRIAKCTAQVSVVGLDDVDLSLVVEFTRSGFTVTGIDFDVRTATQLNKSASYTEDVQTSVVALLVAAGKLTAMIYPVGCATATY
jgi:UDP-N-acetyl-D-mannosaminuronate dehydrogenase